jgi:hypothetical protein
MSNPTLACHNEQRRHAVRAHERLNGLDYLEVEIIEENGQQNIFLCVHFLGPVPSTDQIKLENIQISGGQRILGVRPIGISIHTPEDGSIDGCLRIEVNKLGDFSPYILEIIKLNPTGEFQLDPRYTQLEFTFRAGCASDLDCTAVSGCGPGSGNSSTSPRTEPEINYLAKDYASFRQLILDRFALLMPDWQERHVPDLGITLVEILAYVGDHLSYYQDAVATEAYLQTARQRISVRRHVRLIDYDMHEGCNARTWLWLETSQDKTIPLSGTYFITSYPNAPNQGTILTPESLRNILASQYEVFEPIVGGNLEIPLYQAHNKICFYTWGDRQCCIPKGATSATLRDDWESPETSSPNPINDCKPDQQPPSPPLPPRKLKHLEVGNILIFEEIKGAKTGDQDDADSAHRHVVRLTKVTHREDTLYDYTPSHCIDEGAARSPNQTNLDKPSQVVQSQVEKSVASDTTQQSATPAESKYHQPDQNPAPETRPDNPTPDKPDFSHLPTPIVDIEWAIEDALPFPLCISAIGLAEDGCALIEEISVARGNVLLVDHGRTTSESDLGTVATRDSGLECESENQLAEVTARPDRFRPHLKYTPLTFSQPVNIQDLKTAPASRLGVASPYQDPREAIPQITVQGKASGNTDTPWTKWQSQSDLFGSHGADPHFVVEMDNEGRAYLRFGDGELGQIPSAGTQFQASYRIGNGRAGNIGSGSLRYLVAQNNLSGITIIPHNPFPAQGGTEPEALTEVKLFAPQTFRKQLQRAITPQDYATIVMRDFPQVQRAAATLRWTGSWYEVLVVIDPLGTEVADSVLLKMIAKHLERYQRMGHDVVVKTAMYVFLDILMSVCVKSDYLKGHVKAELLDIFSDRRLANGQMGFFHPDNLTFGTGISLSKLMAIAQAVPGVESVTMKKMQRFAEPARGEIEQGILAVAALEVPRLDNNPNFPERGQFVLEMRGGR